MSAEAGRIDAVLAAWAAHAEIAERIVHVETVPAHGAIHQEPDPPLPERLRTALAERGIDRLYRHQAEAIQRAAHLRAALS